MLICFVVFMGGCFYPISKSIRKEIDYRVTFAELRQNPEACIGKVVLVGGGIVTIVNQQEGTLLEVLQKRLDRWQRPCKEDTSQGRFLVLVSEFLDPAIYREGREITVAGEVTGKKIQRLGDIDYLYPLIRAKELYLWPEYQERVYYPYPVWYYWDMYRFPYWPHR